MAGPEQEGWIKFVFIVEDFNLWAGGKNSHVQFPSSNYRTIGILGNTKLNIQLCPRTSDNMIACHFVRGVDEPKQVSFKYFIYVEAENCVLHFMTVGVVSNMERGGQVIVPAIRRGSLRLVHFPNGLFRMGCQLQRVDPIEPDGFCHGKWKEELEALSDDMGRLLSTGYLSDAKLVSDDGRRIPVHAFLLYARWHKLRESLGERRKSKRIAVHGVSGSVLYAFVSYLYTGKLSESDMSPELYDFAIENAGEIRDRFQTQPSITTFRIKQRKDCLSFTWHVGDLEVDSMSFFRVFPLTEVSGSELLVEFQVEEDGDERYLAVTFSLSEVTENQWISAQCTATFVVDDSPVYDITMQHHFENRDGWHFPNFIPVHTLMSDGGEGPTCREVHFEMVLSDSPRDSFVQGTITEFHTGSLGVSCAEGVASDFRRFFGKRMLEFSDVTLRTTGGYFLSCKALLSVRSKTFWRIFKHPEKNRVVIGVLEKDSVVLARALEYVYTGWVQMPDVKQTLQMYYIAKRLGLCGLVRKCQQFICTRVERSII